MQTKDHWKELGNRLFQVTLLWAVCSVGCYLVADHLFSFLAKPLGAFAPNTAPPPMICTHLLEMWGVYIKIAGLFGFLATCPFLAWHMWQFIAPGLRPKEKKALRWCFVASPLLFVLGGAVAYYGVCPVAWKFFTELHVKQRGVSVHLLPRMADYFNLMLWMMGVFGLFFQIPLALGGCLVFQLVTLSFLRSKRKIVFLSLVVLAALFTPPDLLSPLCLIGGVYGLYEIVLLWATWREKKTTKKIFP